MTNSINRLSILTLMMYALGLGRDMHRIYNSPDADDKVINPPQSEETKQFYIKRAEERRLRKNNKRLIW